MTARNLLLVPLLVPLLAAAPAPPTAAFPAARPGRVFQFPRDHGAHPEFKTEWWYFTGHLWTAQGRRYGYQLTFFRSALPAGNYRGSAAWRSDQLHLAHAALTDVQGQRFSTEQRLNREGLAASAGTAGLALRNAGWSARMTGNEIQLSCTIGRHDLELRLQASAQPVIWGSDGVSRKGADPDATSHYLSFPRLASAGSLDGAPVQGLSWMDHEFSSSQLSRGQVGWDWAGIQLSDGHSLMVYRLRGSDGSQDPESRITEVDADGRVLRSSHGFQLQGQGPGWKGGSGARYPLPLRLEAWGRTLVLEPLVADQELRTRLGTGITYWEGACRVRDSQGQELGQAYVELTGYAHSLQGRF